MLDVSLNRDLEFVHDLRKYRMYKEYLVVGYKVIKKRQGGNEIVVFVTKDHLIICSVLSIADTHCNIEELKTEVNNCYGKHQ
jgi:hypothetical protein